MVTLKGSYLSPTEFTEPLSFQAEYAALHRWRREHDAIPSLAIEAPCSPATAGQGMRSLCIFNGAMPQIVFATAVGQSFV
jgi:hypothetical protein